MPVSEHDLKRLEKLSREFLESLEPGPATQVRDVRIDQLAIVAVTIFRGPDGAEREATLSRFETSRPHVQLGMLHSAVARAEFRLSGGRPGQPEPDG